MRQIPAARFFARRRPACEADEEWSGFDDVPDDDGFPYHEPDEGDYNSTSDDEDSGASDLEDSASLFSSDDDAGDVQDPRPPPPGREPAWSP